MKNYLRSLTLAAMLAGCAKPQTDITSFKGKVIEDRWIQGTYIIRLETAQGMKTVQVKEHQEKNKGLISTAAIDAIVDPGCEIECSNRLFDIPGEKYFWRFNKADYDGGFVWVSTPDIKVISRANVPTEQK